MMLERWLILSGADHGGREQVEARAEMLGLARVHACRSFTVLADPRVPLLIDPVAGLVIIGRLFDRANNARVSILESACASAIVDAPGQRLAGSLWGPYLAIVGDEKAGEVRILRDPSGAIPAYYSKWPSLWAVAGDARLLSAVAPAKPRVDYAAVAARLARPGHHFARTGLIDVTELLPGFALKLGRKSGTEAFWRPSDHLDTAPATPAKLRQVVDGAIDALASCHRRILVTVSGGLDSSIIAASLASRGREISLLTVSTADARGNERPFVKSLADALGLGFACDIYDHADIEIGRATTAHQPWPGARTFAQGYDRRRQDYAVSIEADAIFSGDGGDNVFALTASASPVVDRLRAEGPGAAFRTAIDIARLTSTSVPAVWHRALARLWRGGAALGTPDTSFLGSAGLAMAKSVPDHPWLSPDIAVPPGKAAHIASLVRAQRYRHGYAPGKAEAVLPLLAQPIVECCLSIPSWRWCAGGENRAVARAAYSDLLPKDIAHRRTKGGADSFCVELIERHRPAIRDMLLGGLLAQHGLLDRAAIAQSLDEGAAERGDVHRILAFVDAEAWVRSWS